MTLPVPAFLDIDLAGRQAEELLSAVAARQGEAIAAVAGHCRRLFLMRSPWAPGMRCVGAVVQNAASASVPADALTFDVAGAGADLDGAVASCLGEGAERLSAVQRVDDIEVVSSYASVFHRVMPQARDVIEAQLGGPHSSAGLEFAWSSAIDLHTGAKWLLPANWCFWGAKDDVLRRTGLPLSAGLAAGPAFEAAAVSALLELVERDAASQWWVEGRRGSELSVDDNTRRRLADHVGFLRAGSAGRRTELLDITTDLGIPCVAAFSFNATGDGMCFGLAARLNTEDAARRAIVEMCQMELGLLLARMKEREEPGFLTQADKRHILRAEAIKFEDCAKLHSSGGRTMQNLADTGSKSPLDIIRSVFSQARIEAALIDLTRRELGIPAVRAVAPKLRPLLDRGLPLGGCSDRTGSHHVASDIPLL